MCANIYWPFPRNPRWQLRNSLTSVTLGMTLFQASAAHSLATSTSLDMRSPRTPGLSPTRLLSTHYTLTNRWRWAFLLCLIVCLLKFSFYAKIYFVFIDKCLVLVWTQGHSSPMSKNRRSESALFLLSHLTTFILIMQTREAAWQHQMEEH